MWPPSCLLDTSMMKIDLKLWKKVFSWKWDVSLGLGRHSGPHSALQVEHFIWAKSTCFLQTSRLARVLPFWSTYFLSFFVTQAIAMCNAEIVPQIPPVGPHAHLRPGWCSCHPVSHELTTLHRIVLPVRCFSSHLWLVPVRSGVQVPISASSWHLPLRNWAISLVFVSC